MAVIERFSPSSPSRFQTLNRLSIGFASVGLVIAGFLSAAHSTGAVIPCGPSHGCEAVAADPSSMLWGIPVANYGVLAYAMLLLLGVLRTYVPQPVLITRVGTLVSFLGTVISAAFTYHAVTVIHATCIWCLGSAAVMAISFLLHIGLLRRPDTQPNERRPLLAVGLSAGPVLMAGALFIFLSSQPQISAAKAPFPAEKVNFVQLMRSAHLKGRADNPVTIVEFADLYCGACQIMHERVSKLVAHNPNSVSWGFLHLPLTTLKGHEMSYDAAVRSELAAKKGRFWEFLETMYTGKVDKTKTSLDKALVAVTQDNSIVGQSATEEKARIKDGLAIAKNLGIVTTPTYLVFVDKKFVGVAEASELANIVARPEVIAHFQKQTGEVATR